MNFSEKLKNSVLSANSVLCVGLDPVSERIPGPLRDTYPDPPKHVLEFCRRVIEATKTHACAFKANTAFFEAMGSEGWAALEEVIEMVPSNRILILDAKRGDIGNTAENYRKALFDRLNADAVTLNPLMGMDTLNPFLNDTSKAAFVLTMTSNRGAGDFLRRRFEGRMSLGEYIAEELAKKQAKSETHLGMVVGATQTAAARAVMQAYPTAHLLIPGIGAQGGSVEQLVQITEHHKGIPVISSSRSVIYAGGDETSWMEQVAEKAMEVKNSLSKITERYV
jgi:orotidine-5'-phosphate decarboxylase